MTHPNLRLKLLLALVIGGASPPILANVLKDYNLSVRYYKSKRLSKAVKKLRSTIKKYPKHLPSIELLAKIYIERKRFKSAARLIFRSKPSYVNGDIAFSLGIHYYSKGECRFTSYFLKRVPADYRHHDDSLIYRSVCLLREQKWTQAYTLLRRAKRTDPSLVATKQDLLRVARRASRSETSGFRSGGSFTVTQRAPILSYTPYTAPIGDTVNRRKLPKSIEKTAVKRGLDVKTTPKFELELLNDQTEKHGFSNLSSTSTTYSAGGNVYAAYDFALSGGRAAKLYSGFGLSYETSQITGESIKNQFSASNPDQIVSESTPIEDDGTVEEYMLFTASPGMSYPFNPYWSLYLNYVFEKYFLEYKTSSNAVEVGTNVSVDSVALSAAFRNYSESDEEGNKTTSSNNVSASLSKDWEKLSADMNVLFTLKGDPVDLEEFDGPLSTLKIQAAIDYSLERYNVGLSFGLISQVPNEKVPLLSADNGATQQVAIKGKVEVPLPYNLNISVNAGYEILTDYVVPGKSTEINSETSEAGDIVAQGSKIGFTPVITYKPLDFLSIKLSYGIDQYTYTTEIPEDQAVFEQSVTNLAKKFTGVISLSKTL